MQIEYGTAEVRRRLRIAVPEREGLSIASDCFVDPTSILQHDPEVAQNFGSIRLQRQCLLVARDGCVGLSQGFQREPEVGEGFRNVRIQRKRLLVTDNRFRQIAGLMKAHGLSEQSAYFFRRADELLRIDQRLCGLLASQLCTSLSTIARHDLPRN